MTATAAAVPGPVNEKAKEENDGTVASDDGGGEGDGGCATSKLKRSHESETPAATAQQRTRRKVDLEVSMTRFSMLAT